MNPGTSNDKESAKKRKLDTLLDISKYYLIYYDVSDPGFEYEIVPEEDIESKPLGVIQEGETIRVKFGPARRQGIVVRISEDKEDLEHRHDEFVEVHQESIRCKKIRRKRSERGYIYHVEELVLTHSVHLPVATNEVKMRRLDFDPLENHKKMQKLMKRLST